MKILYGGFHSEDINRRTFEWKVVKDNNKAGCSRFLILLKSQNRMKNYRFKKSEEFLKRLCDEDMLKVWLHYFQNKRFSMPWTVSTRHVISGSGNVWDGSIVSNDFFREKKYLLIRIESHKKDLKRPRTKWTKLANHHILRMR